MIYSDYLGQLIITPKMAAVKIRNVKDNKKRVDQIPLKLLLEIVEQISIPFATTVFNLSLEEGIVPLEWKEANSLPLFKKRFGKRVREQ